MLRCLSPPAGCDHHEDTVSPEALNTVLNERSRNELMAHFSLFRLQLNHYKKNSEDQRPQCWEAEPPAAAALTSPTHAPRLPGSPGGGGSAAVALGFFLQT